MKKLAIFVEGMSELLFAEALLREIAGTHNVLIEQRRVRGGVTVPRTMTVLSAAHPRSGQKYYVLLVDCGSDEQVKTRILEEHLSLTKSNYLGIIGIRDVRPTFTHADIPKLEAGLRMYVKTSLIPVVFVLSVMELEAWFLAEFSHFPRIDQRITVEEIRRLLGFDPEHDDMSLRPLPSADLDACYGIGGQAYTKATAGQTVGALDYARVYLELPAKFPHLATLMATLDAFFVGASP